MSYQGKRCNAIKRLALLGFLLLGVLVCSSAMAQSDTPSMGIFDEIMDTYEVRSRAWQDTLQGIARSLFGGLAVISLAWTAIKLLLKKNELESLIPTIAMQILTLGFFLFLVEKGPWIAGLIVDSFQQAGMRVSGAPQLSPSGVIILGFESLFRIFDAIKELSWGDVPGFALPLAFAGIVILAAFTAVGLLLLLTFIEAYIVASAGVIMLGFGALPWTRDIPKNYLTYALNVGVKLFILYLVVSIGMSLAEEWPAMIATTGNVESVLHNAFYIMSASLIFAAIAWKVPGIAAALTTGSVNMSAADALGVGAAAGAMAGGTAAIASGGLSTAAGGLAAATKGAVQAGSAGMNLAKEQGASGLAASVKGIGHAVGAVKSEAGAAMKAKAGLSPPSAASMDGRGRDVGNLGTRAANRLADEAQGAREAGARAPAPQGAAGSVAAAGGSSGGSTGSAAGTAGANASVTQGAAAGPTPGAGAASAGPASAGPASAGRPTLPGKATTGAGEFKPPAPNEKGALDQLKALQPPQLPPEGGAGGVTITFGNADD